MTEDLKYKEVLKLILNKKHELNYTEEDEKKITKLWEKYYKKIKPNSSKEVLAGAVLWLYSKLNSLWENDKTWSQKSLAAILKAKQKTISDKTREISMYLKIRNWDNRFCRKDVAESNPLNNYVILPESGFISTREQAIKNGMAFIPVKKTKEDCFYDGIDLISQDNEKALRCFKQAIEIDDEYVDAYNGIGELNFFKDPKKSKECYKKAFDLSLKHFKGKWPEELLWGILKNRQYLRSIHGYGLMLWREGKSDEAFELFKLLLKLNKYDNQGARYLVAAIYAGLKWGEMEQFDEDNERMEKLFENQNKKHKFFDFED